MSFIHNSKTTEIRDRVSTFMAEHIFPIEKTYLDFVHNNPAMLFPAMEDLKEKARAADLWNLFLPHEYKPYSPGLTNFEYAPLAEEMGKVPWASEVFNCSAPDTGNMEVLAKYGSDEQKEKWLEPLLAGEIRSAFLMTEPDIASSDARNIETRIEDRGDHYEVNGHKWWATGAAHPNCKLYVVLGKTDTKASPHEQHSMILIPSDAKGVKIIRNLTVMNQHDPPGEHCEITLEGVRVPKDQIILGEGKGFAIAQGRLGPGRIHHCMRLIGMAQRSLDYMIKRVGEREAFGRSFKDFSSIRQTIAAAYCKVEQARLLTLSAADKIDKYGIKDARDLVAAIKIVVPKMVCEVSDHAMQLYGGKGVSDDLPLVQFYTAARALRLADGPDEVHLDHLGRMLIRKAEKEGLSNVNYFN